MATTITNSPRGGISILPSIDAIQEFKVLTYNYSAEYGTRAGPTVLVTTKSGRTSFTGRCSNFSATLLWMRAAISLPSGKNST